MNAKEARAMLLSGSAPIIGELLRLATGELYNADKPEMGYKNCDPIARKCVLDAVIPMMQKIEDANVVTAQSTADVISMLKAGQISIADAKELMEMFNLKYTAESTTAGQLEAMKMR